MTNRFALIVEDRHDLAIIFARALQEAGFDTQIARSGDVALNWLSNITPDIVVLDLHLPRVSGAEVLQHIRSDPNLAASKVIIVTADPQYAEIYESQVDLVLLKPVSYGQLRELATRLGFAPANTE